MRTSLAVVLTLCAFAAAMVPMERRILNPEEAPISSTGSQGKVICSTTTPCAWSTYNEVKIIESNITNSYCSCSTETECKPWKEDISGKVITYRCMPPGTETEVITETES
ncbi:hypothetical protein NE865_03727 [Phthorimaea operculella]|nr:hypothetical protein NE865_03727 [Phthorimaea operculella]